MMEVHGIMNAAGGAKEHNEQSPSSITRVPKKALNETVRWQVHSPKLLPHAVPVSVAMGSRDCEMFP